MAQFRVEVTNARSWTDEQMDALFAEGFPAFITSDQEVKRHIGRVRELFTTFDVILSDDDAQPVATGWGVPISWSGEVAELPLSFAEVLNPSSFTMRPAMRTRLSSAAQSSIRTVREAASRRNSTERCVTRPLSMAW